MVAPPGVSCCGVPVAAAGPQSEGALPQCQLPALELEQELLALDPEPVSHQCAGGTHHTMAGHDDGDGVAPVGGPDGARRGRPADGCGNSPIAGRLATGDLSQRLPDQPLEGGAAHAEAEVE